mmetsp:Transcript_19747/g.58924  ORF Transcript_19747/g.58924 Transcript_19747/m.58924 type:complete len:515 (+) Transcript_19747:107-1651(+)
MHRRLSQLSGAAASAGDSLEFSGFWNPILEEHCTWSQLYRDDFLDSVTSQFVQPLQALRVKQEKERKSLKDTWAKETKKVADSATTVSRTRARYVALSQEWERALLARDRDREALERTGGFDAKTQRLHNRRIKDEAELRVKVEEARQAYSAAVRQANLLAADVNSYRRIVVSKLMSILFEGSAKLKQVLISYFDLARLKFRPRGDDHDTMRRLAEQHDSQDALKKALRKTVVAGGAVDATKKHTFERFRLGPEALECLRHSGEINQCDVAAVEREHLVHSNLSHARELRPAARGGRKSMFRQRISRVIGVPLEDQPCDPELGVPAVVSVLVAAVEQHLDEEGLYRKPGVKSHIEKLCTEIPARIADHSGVPITLEGYDAHVIASTLKMYFRQLPIALVPPPLATAALDVVKGLRDRVQAPAPAEAVRLLVPIIARMPAVNRATLAFMIRHLGRVAARSGENKMKLSALAIVFGPTLLRTDDDDQLASLQHMPLQVSTVELMITNREKLFAQEH